MIEKVIIAEDHESSNLSVQKVMEDLRILQSDYFYYCDDALNRIKVAKNADKPYEVLITDLYFDDDGTSQTIKDGFELIKAAREVQPDIRVIVFSSENKPAKIKSLYDEMHIDGFVRKARHDVKELKLAFEAITKGDRYYSRETSLLLKQTKAYEFTDFDISIIRLLAEGHRQKEISDQLECSASTIEKTLKKLRDEFGFLKNEQLVLKLKDAGLL
ncbi:helix-turn-helix domain-containing protein [Ferruginibacter sp. HRS2-29]|uniref:helix-turn-helix domain-containing protein n=1 Tax=Ferruginibacter sp. HRS2-29 TaxID=2487334 RepID=UPI0020CCBF17|nr:helix-turn-helix domain-containing protein [Ferruginibacter sp. HRS2-29]MCP9752368.1 DNA-binding response regulator [Ferruginibacter sp. HRS2-29]